MDSSVVQHAANVLKFVSGQRPASQDADLNPAIAAAGALLEYARKTQGQLTKAQALAAQYSAPATASAVQALKLAPALSHSVLDALSQPYTTRAQTLQSQINSDYLQATAIRQKLVALDAKNAPYQFALAQDAAAGRQYTTAAKALKAYLDLEPNLDQATRQQLEQTLKALQAFGTTPSSP